VECRRNLYRERGFGQQFPFAPWAEVIHLKMILIHIFYSREGEVVSRSLVAKLAVGAELELVVRVVGVARLALGPKLELVAGVVGVAKLAVRAELQLVVGVVDVAKLPLGRNSRNSCPNLPLGPT
jgi:hypothetical protein